MMLMFMAVMISATPLMQSVVEEKMQRIAEVLLGSVRPFDLMLGKLLGMTGVSLTITAVYLGGVYWAARYYGFAEYIPCLRAGVVSRLSDFSHVDVRLAFHRHRCGLYRNERRRQNLMWPVMLLVMLPMFLMGSILQEPQQRRGHRLVFLPLLHADDDDYAAIGAAGRTELAALRRRPSRSDDDTGLRLGSGAHFSRRHSHAG